MKNNLNPLPILNDVVKSDSIQRKFELLTPLEKLKFYPPLLTGLQYLNTEMRSKRCSDDEIIKSMNILLTEFIDLLVESKRNLDFP